MHLGPCCIPVCKTVPKYGLCVSYSLLIHKGKWQMGMCLTHQNHHACRL